MALRNRLGGGLPTYQYYYTGNFSNITPLHWIGAAHTVELPLVTGQHSHFRGESTDFEWEVSAAMQGKDFDLLPAKPSDPSADHPTNRALAVLCQGRYQGSHFMLQRLFVACLRLRR
jgi:hypothetical protein